ncbi:MAG: alpha/beta hydrolase [bacterium]
MKAARPRQAAVLSGIAACCCLAIAALTALPGLPAGAAVGGFSILRVATRPGVTVRVALGIPLDHPAGVLVMFPGANGAGQFREAGGAVILGGNFLVRTAPQYLTRGWAVAIVDVPSDHPSGMSDDFRMSAAHAADVRKIIEALAAQSLGPVYLVGTSAGTTSVAYLGTVLTDGSINGIVLTSTMRAVAAFPLSRVNVPVLIVHHQTDTCPFTPPSSAERLPGLFKGSPKVTFVWARGGTTPTSTACEAFAAHGYIGIESEVVDAIARWAAGEDVPSVVGR